MKGFFILLLLSLFLLVPLLLGMTSSTKMVSTRVKNPFITIETEPDLKINEGYLSQEEETILINNGKKTIAEIHLSEPVLVAQAEQDEAWGYYQFPGIGKTENGILRITWQMKDDSHKTYGEESKRKNTPMISKDGGETWMSQDKNYSVEVRGYNIRMKNGVKLQVRTPTAKDIKTYNKFPEPVGKRKNYTYYKEDQMPEELRGVYFVHTDKDNRTSSIHAQLNDPGLLRYSVDGMAPVVWWGNIKELADGSLIAGVYPTNYLNEEGTVSEDGVSFYHSNDEGYTWDVVSRIIIKDDIVNIRNNISFTEPTFEILPDSTFICVMRSGAYSPLYRVFSYDRGKTWTRPEAFTPNGVKPKLMTLLNGTLVLVSGRPGIQLRLSFDGGHAWTEAIDMIPFMNEDGSFDRHVSCGYASIIEAGDNSLNLVYSDFTTKDKSGDIRKSIWFRKVDIKKE